MQNTPLQEIEDDEIDIVGLIKYLWENILTIIALGMIPVFGFLLFAAVDRQVLGDRYMEAILWVETESDQFKPSSLVSEAILGEIIQEKNLTSRADELIKNISVTVGYREMNRQITEALEKLSRQTSVAKNETVEEVRLRYDNLIATQGKFLTITLNLKESKLNPQTAKIVLTALIDKNNEQFADGILLSEVLLAPIDLDLFEGLGIISPYTVNNFQGIIFSLQDLMKKVKKSNYNKKGFNQEVMDKRIGYVDFELRKTISGSQELRDYFFQELERELSVERKKIESVRDALDNISGKAAEGVTLGGNSEINSEIFDRFLNLGATVSLVEFQQELMEQKIKLEFRVSEIEERMNAYTGLRQDREVSQEGYTQILEETKEIALKMNDFTDSYNQNYNNKFLNMIQLVERRPESLFNLKWIAIVFVASFGLSFMIFLVRKAFVEKDQPAN
jgi:hypothetical protein